MKIYHISDLHLEFKITNDYFSTIFDNFKYKKDSVLILNGDIDYISKIRSGESIIHKLANKFDSTYLICGNHEFYDGSDISILINPYIEEINNIRLCNNISIKINDCNLVFSSLFTNIKPYDEFNIRRGMSDYYKINFGNDSYIPFHTNQICNSAKQFIQSEIINNKNNIIFTHHLPTKLLVDEKYKTSSINSGFYVEMFDFIEEFSEKIPYWIYGHNHTNKKILINKTILDSNQFGYYNENLKNFDIKKNILI